MTDEDLAFLLMVNHIPTISSEFGDIANGLSQIGVMQKGMIFSGFSSPIPSFFWIDDKIISDELQARRLPIWRWELVNTDRAYQSNGWRSITIGQVATGDHVNEVKFLMNIWRPVDKWILDD